MTHSRYLERGKRRYQDKAKGGDGKSVYRVCRKDEVGLSDVISRVPVRLTLKLSIGVHRTRGMTRVSASVSQTLCAAGQSWHVVACDRPGSPQSPRAHCSTSLHCIMSSAPSFSFSALTSRPRFCSNPLRKLRAHVYVLAHRSAAFLQKAPVPSSGSSFKAPMRSRSTIRWTVSPASRYASWILTYILLVAVFCAHSFPCPFVSAYLVNAGRRGVEWRSE